VANRCSTFHDIGFYFEHLKNLQGHSRSSERTWLDSGQVSLAGDYGYISRTVSAILALVYELIATWCRPRDFEDFRM